MNDSLLTVDDLCKELGIGKNTGYALIKNKKIKAAKVGKRHLIHRKELEKYIANTILEVEK